MVEIVGKKGGVVVLNLIEGVVFSRIDDEGIIVDTNTGRYLALNRTATEMLSTMMESDDNEEVIAKITKLMDVDHWTLEVDLKALVSRLVELGLMHEAAPT